MILLWRAAELELARCSVVDELLEVRCERPAGHDVPHRHELELTALEWRGAPKAVPLWRPS